MMVHHKNGFMKSCKITWSCWQEIRRQFHSSSKALRKKVLKSPEYYDSMPVFQYATKNTKQKTHVFSWGISSTGALGNISYLMPEKPETAVLKYLRRPGKLDFSNSHEVTDVACGYGFTVYAVKRPKDNNFCVFGTGLNTDCQIGRHCNNSGKPLQILVQPVPIEVPLLSNDTKVISVACGRSHTVVCTDAEGVFALGNNSFGQCGRKTIETEDYSKGGTIKKVQGIEGKVVKVFCGQDHTHFLTEDGQLYSSGLGCDGQTGLGHYNNQDLPQKVRGDIESEKIVDIGCSADCTLAINDKGDLFGWGNSEYKQLSAVTSYPQISTPTHIPLPDVGKVVSATAGGTMCAIVNESGQVYVWGYGILGKGPKVTEISTPESIPQPLFGVNEFSPDKKVISVHANLDYLAAITDSGDLYTWGRNEHGKLGLGGKMKFQYFPLRVSLGGPVKKVSLGSHHAVALCSLFM